MGNLGSTLPLRSSLGPLLQPKCHRTNPSI